MKVYKPNSSTLLYLNSSFNCTKSSSVTLTKVLSGTGYTGNPTIVITPAAGDLGYGASATITQASGVLGTLTTVSTGKGYNTLPTVSLVGGGSPGAITGVTISNGGSGYTSAPTITASGGGGTGFTATAILTGGVITSVYISQQGKNYATLPTIVITGGGGSGAVIAPVITLGTEGTFTVAFTKTFTYTWNIPDIVIDDLGKLSVVNINATGYTAATPYTFRIIGLQYDSRNSFCSDYGNPIISIAQQTNLCTLGSIGNTVYNITLTPQTIRQIQISVDDSITAKDTGVVVAINFVIALEIEEFDPVMTEIGNPYQEATSRLKLQY